MTWQKIFSGKLIFTVVTSVVFAYAAYAKILTGEQIQSVVMLVVAAYFGRVTTNGKEQANDK